jgi:DNA-binding response OmpR family regulator
LPLSVQLTDANAAIKDIVELFSVGADQKDISLKVEGADNQLFTWLDPDIFEKVMYNLLSNAIKYTPTGGSIKVRSKVCSDVSSLFPGKEHKDGDHLVVEVADSGIGIPEESLSLIFERFGQAFPSQKKSGTGIGLYFAKAMVELHHGFIKAGNDGGAVFTFALPMSQSAYSEFERSQKEDTRRAVDSKRYLSEYTAGSETPQPVSDITILVIDDDYEIVYFLKTILSPHYKVVSTFDAMSGYKMIESEDPDIIISDVMMYEMDGIQFCKMVKENGDYCHIPLILLTAKSSVANQIEGLNAGADAYIVKPFDPDYLLATIGTLLRNRENVRNILGRSTKVGKALDDSVSAKDRKLLETVYTLFEENLSNTDINAGDFADKCGISRTKFFYKVKALTGMTPAEYFRAYKLNRAVELIKEDKYKMSGIAEMCGFSSPSHFATSFKKHFGVLPSEYLDSL